MRTFSKVKYRISQNLVSTTIIALCRPAAGYSATAPWKYPIITSKLAIRKNKNTNSPTSSYWWKLMFRKNFGHYSMNHYTWHVLIHKQGTNKGASPEKVPHLWVIPCNWKLSTTLNVLWKENWVIRGWQSVTTYHNVCVCVCVCVCVRVCVCVCVCVCTICTQNGPNGSKHKICTSETIKRVMPTSISLPTKRNNLLKPLDNKTGAPEVLMPRHYTCAEPRVANGCSYAKRLAVS